MNTVATAISSVPALRVDAESRLGVLAHLKALTFTFEAEGKRISPVLIYSEPDPDHPGEYRAVLAADTGYEGIACVDDTARAALLALAVYEKTKDAEALRLARRWLGFVQYMQYPDGDFANFIRNTSGRRNVSGATSLKGGPWWTVRALWSLARAYRVTGGRSFLESYERCTKPTIPDGKIQALLALGEVELYRAIMRRPGQTRVRGLDPQAMRRQLLERAEIIVQAGGLYFRDHHESATISVWGYHQLHAVASIARLLEHEPLVGVCRVTVDNLVQPIVSGRFYYRVGPDVDGPGLAAPIPLRGEKEGVCAYCVTPIVQGLAEMYRLTGAGKFRRLALQAAAWFYGRNDARVKVYTPSNGRCADGIDDTRVSPNFGAESSIEAGLAEIERLGID